MQVILSIRSPNWAGLGDQVSVKAGYAQLPDPARQAVMATIQHRSLRCSSRRTGSRWLPTRPLPKSALLLAELVAVVIASKSGDEGKLFGSIGTRDVAEAITAAGVAVAKSEVRMGNVLRNTGEYEVIVQLHADVKATVQIQVVAL